MKCIQAAASRNHLDIVKLLSTHGIVDTRTASISLMYAVGNNGLDTVKFFLEYPQVDLNYRDSHGVKRAIQKGYSEIINLLCENERFVMP